MTDTTKVEEEIMDTIAMVSSDVWKARVSMYLIRPLMFLVGIAMYALGLYGGTWIVVLALRHSGAI